MLAGQWRIELLGGLRATQGEQVVSRFRTQKTASLFAYLAFYLRQSHPRETLIERFWAESDEEAGRKSLRVSLSSLRHQLELPGVVAGTVLIADRAQIHLNPAACVTDTAEFEESLLRAGKATETAPRIAALKTAVEGYGGELLPGFFDDWVLTERDRLTDQFLGAMRRLVKEFAQERAYEEALTYAHRVVAADPLRESSCRDLMRLYAAVGRGADALERYVELERLLARELGEPPSAATRQLAAEISQGGKITPSPTRAAFPAAALSPASATASAPLPPSLPVAAPRLPLTLTRFFGRKDELEALTALLQPVHTDTPTTPRLITLLGQGGNGKTRLSLEAARRVREAYEGAVWFVSLADLTDAALLPTVVQDTLGVPRDGEGEPLQRILSALTGKPVLLLLDNFEQLTAGGAPFVLRLLTSLPQLVCLVTSRKRLSLPGEKVFEVAPLPLPVEEDPLVVIAGSPSAQLFVDRAQSVRPDFQVTPHNAASVAALCHCLEGIPLAIELAAARAQVLSPAQLVERISQRFELLANRRTEKGSRHQSLWAALDWSYQLLPAPVRRFFAQMGVFRGGCTLEAAEAVCGEESALDYLEQLRSHSFVQVEDNGTSLRFRMLETVREFAVEQWAGEERTATAERHADYLRSRAEAANVFLRSERQTEWLARLEQERENFRAALAWACAEDGERAVLLTAALGRFWEIRGDLQEARRWYDRALAHPTTQIPARLRAYYYAGIMAQSQGEPLDARGYFEESLRLSRETGDAEGEANALHGLGVIAFNLNDYGRAETLLADALERNRALGGKWLIARSLNMHGLIARRLHSDEERAQAYYAEAVALLRETGDRRMLTHLLYNLAIAALDHKEYARARTLMEECLHTYGELNCAFDQIETLYSLAIIAEFEEDMPRACKFYRDCLRLCQKMGDRKTASAVLWCLADYDNRRGLAARAARLLGATEAIREKIGYTFPPHYQDDYTETVHATRTALGDARYRALWAEGNALPIEEAIALGLASAQTAIPDTALSENAPPDK